MKSERIFSAAFAAVLLLSAVSCGKGAQQPSETEPVSVEPVETAAEETYDFGESDYGGYEFKVLNLDTAWNTNIRLDFDEMTGEGLNDAIYQRNRKIEEKLNFVMKEIQYPYPGWDKLSQIADEIIQSVLASDYAYDAAYVLTSFKPGIITDGYLYDFYEIPEMKMDEDYWDRSVNDIMMFDGHLYAASSPLCLSSLDMSWVLLFNETMMGRLDLAYPYQLVRDGEWTLDRFLTYVQTAASLNGDSSFAFSENGSAVYGIAGHSDSPIGFAYAAGNLLLEQNSGDYTVNVESERLFGTYDKLCSVLSSKQGYVLWNNDGTQPGGYENLFRNGRALFTCCELKTAHVERSMEETFGLLPMPKLDEAQESYYACMNFAAPLLTIPLTQEDVSRTGKIIDALTYESWQSVLPIYYETTLAQKSLRNEASIEMLEIIRNNRVVDFGCILGITNSFVSSFNSAVVSNSKSIASVSASNAKTIVKKLETVKENFAKREAGE